jgi:glutaredoxin
MHTVYSKTNCPGCTVVKKKLEQLGYGYLEVNIDKDQNAKQWLIDQGHRSVPVVLFNGKVVDHTAL